MEKTKYQLGNILLSIQTSSTRNGLHLTELLAKGTPWKSQTTQANIKVIGFSPQIKSLILKRAPSQLSKCREL